MCKICIMLYISFICINCIFTFKKIAIPTWKYAIQSLYSHLEVFCNQDKVLTKFFFKKNAP